METKSKKDHYAIDPALAADYINKWNSGEYQIISPKTKKKSDKELALNGFTFSLKDFRNFLAKVDLYNAKYPEEQIDAVFCSLAIKPSPYLDYPKEGQGTDVPTLIFEPVKGFKTPSFFDKVKVEDIDPGVKMPSLPIDEEIEGVLTTTSVSYDYAYPCPPTCTKN